jgi:hypothetical protein
MIKEICEPSQLIGLALNPTDAGNSEKVGYRDGTE